MSIAASTPVLPSALAPLAVIAATYLAAAATPGPNMMLVGHVAAGRSRGAGLAAAAGVAAGTLIWLVLSLAGIGLLMQQAGDVYRLLRLFGAAYLVFVGVRMLLAGWRGPAGAAQGRAATAPRGRSPFVLGLLTNLTNPKSAVFWTSVFMVVLPARIGLGFEVALVAVILSLAFLWYGFVAVAFSTAAVRRSYAAAARWLDGATGLIMIGLGLKLADEVRREIAA